MVCSNIISIKFYCQPFFKVVHHILNTTISEGILFILRISPSSPATLPLSHHAAPLVPKLPPGFPSRGASSEIRVSRILLRCSKAYRLPAPPAPVFHGSVFRGKGVPPEDRPVILLCSPLRFPGRPASSGQGIRTNQIRDPG